MDIIESKPVADQTAELDALLADLDLMGSSDDEIIETVEEDLSETDLEAAVARAETQEEIAAHYDALTDEVAVVPEIASADPLTLDPTALLLGGSDEVTEPESATPSEEPTTTPAEPEKKAKGKGKKSEPAATDTEKPEPKKRVCYSSKSERLADKFKDKLDEYMVLELDDAALEGDALAAKVAETKQTIKDSGVKVQNRITFILEFIGGKSANLNGVIKTAFTLLAKDGKITTGDTGNLHTALLAHPYNDKSARAMGGNSLLAMRQLKVVVAGAKGEWVPNPNSLVLMKMNSMLGL